MVEDYGVWQCQDHSGPDYILPTGILVSQGDVSVNY